MRQRGGDREGDGGDHGWGEMEKRLDLNDASSFKRGIIIAIQWTSE